MMVLNIESLKDARITLSLIFVNVLMFIVFSVALPQENVLIFVQINRNVILNYELWRLFTSLFFHGDYIHLFSNMLGLLIFGATVENNRNISKLKYLIIYFISGLIGNLFTLILLPLNTISLGASGAIFGLIGVAFIIVATDSPPLLFYAIFYIAYFVVASLGPGINLWAHIFGLLGGLIFGFFFYTRNRKVRLDY